MLFYIDNRKFENKSNRDCVEKDASSDDYSRFIKYRHLLCDNQKDCYSFIDDMMIKISCGGFTLSIATLGIIHTQKGIELPCYWNCTVIAVWIMYAACIAINFFSQKLATKKLDKLIKYIDNQIKNDSQYDANALTIIKRAEYSILITLNTISEILLILASLSLLFCLIVWIRA